MVPNLESLILEGCIRMVDVHPSIGVLRNLKILNLRNCKSLKRLPEINGQMECLLELYLDGTGIEELPSSIGHTTIPAILFCSAWKIAVTFGCKGPPSKLRPGFPSLFKLLHGESSASMALMLSTLSGLSSLTKLNLSGCNIWEGPIPSDIYCLSCLETLNLCGNNFMSLPATLSRLSKLRFLLLSDCKLLKSLPELLTSIKGVFIDGCSSLEAFANPKSICDPSMYRPYLIGTSCYRLSMNSKALKMKNKFLKVFASAPLFDIIVPGNDIPKWFRHQSDECSIKIPLPYNLQNDTQWMGVAFCFAFFTSFTDDDDDAYKGQQVMCKVVIQGRNSKEVNMIGCSFGR
ncbi:hypothetical protein DITRI_Ditri01bG0148200 [Diplodiscus trichospermus]